MPEATEETPQEGRIRLERLLMVCYTMPLDLYHFFTYLTGGLDVVRQLTFPSGLEALACEGVRQLVARRMVQTQLFTQIASDRPNRVREIAEVARCCGVRWPDPNEERLLRTDRSARRTRSWFELLPPSGGPWEGWVAVVRPDFPLIERTATTPRDVDDLSCRAVMALARGVAEVRAALRSGQWGPANGRAALYCIQRNASCMLIGWSGLDAQLSLLRALELLCSRCDAPLVGGLAHGAWGGEPAPFLIYGVTGAAPREAVGLIREVGTWAPGGPAPLLRLAMRREGRSSPTLELPGDGWSREREREALLELRFGALRPAPLVMLPRRPFDQILALQVLIPHATASQADRIEQRRRDLWEAMTYHLPALLIHRKAGPQGVGPTLDAEQVLYNPHVHVLTEATYDGFRLAIPLGCGIFDRVTADHISDWILTLLHHLVELPFPVGVALAVDRGSAVNNPDLSAAERPYLYAGAVLQQLAHTAEEVLEALTSQIAARPGQACFVLRASHKAASLLADFDPTRDDAAIWVRRSVARDGAEVAAELCGPASPALFRPYRNISFNIDGVDAVRMLYGRDDRHLRPVARLARKLFGGESGGGGAKTQGAAGPPILPALPDAIQRVQVDALWNILIENTLLAALLCLGLHALAPFPGAGWVSWPAAWSVPLALGASALSFLVFRFLHGRAVVALFLPRLRRYHYMAGLHATQGRLAEVMERASLSLRSQFSIASLGRRFLGLQAHVGVLPALLWCLDGHADDRATLIPRRNRLPDAEERFLVSMVLLGVASAVGGSATAMIWLGQWLGLGPTELAWASLPIGLTLAWAACFYLRFKSVAYNASALSIQRRTPDSPESTRAYLLPTTLTFALAVALGATYLTLALTRPDPWPPLQVGLAAGVCALTLLVKGALVNWRNNETWESLRRLVGELQRTGGTGDTPHPERPLGALALDSIGYAIHRLQRKHAALRGAMDEAARANDAMDLREQLLKAYGRPENTGFVVPWPYTCLMGTAPDQILLTDAFGVVLWSSVHQEQLLGVAVEKLVQEDLPLARYISQIARHGVASGQRLFIDLVVYMRATPEGGPTPSPLVATRLHLMPLTEGNNVTGFLSWHYTIEPQVEEHA